MYTISLHRVKMIAPIGLYPQEKILSNEFEVDMDVFVQEATEQNFVDYTLLNNIICSAFQNTETVLEVLVFKIHKAVLLQFPFVQKVKVVIRKMNPPMPGEMAYAQVSYEK